MGRVRLSASKKEKLQRKLSRFIRGINYKNQKQLKELAIDFEMTPPKFSKLIHPSEPYSPFISAMEYLYSLASFEKGLELSQFVNLLEGKVRKKSDREDLLPIEKKILNGFSQVREDLLGEFAKFIGDKGTGKRKIEAMLRLVLFLKKMDTEDIEQLSQVLRSITKKSIIR